MEKPVIKSSNETILHLYEELVKMHKRLVELERRVGILEIQIRREGSPQKQRPEDGKRK